MTELLKFDIKSTTKNETELVETSKHQKSHNSQWNSSILKSFDKNGKLLWIQNFLEKIYKK